MNMKRTRIYLVTAAVLLALAGCDHALEPTGGAITIDASVGPMTKVTYDGAGSAFAAGDKLALYAWTGGAASVPAERVVNGVVNTFDGSTWTPASLMRWADASTPHYFLGVSPAPAAAITDLTAVPYTLDPADYTASDLLLASNFGTDGAGVKPSATPVPLAFDHAMAKLAVNLKFRTEWATVPASVSVTITAKTGATVNYLTKSVTATGTAAPLVLPDSAAASDYNLSFGSLMVPQDGVRRIVVSVDGIEYAYEYGSDIPLNSGKATTLGLILGRDKLDLGDISVVDWETETLAEAEAEMDMLTVPLTIEAKTAETHVTFILSSIVAANSVEYRTSSGMAWSDWETYTGSAILLKNQGDKVQFRGDNATYATGIADYSHFQFDKDCYVYGNVMSLVGGEDFSSCFTLTGKHTFARLFYGNHYLLSHASKRLLLPATTLTEECYRGLFEHCIFLTVAPALPATTLASYCYFEMFVSCLGLTAAPALPATTLAFSCYDSMFSGSGLTTAPVLPATTLADNCYAYMFYDCRSLTSAPVLPATMLADYCYEGMFYGCRQLNSVTCLAVGISAYNCTSEWLKYVAATGTFTAPACMEGVWPTNDVSGIPPGWTFVRSTEGAGAEGFTLSYPGEWE